MAARQVDGLIFDLDGTLWSSSAACVKAWNRALEELGESQRVTPAEVEGIMGLPHEKVFAQVFPAVAGERRERLAVACYQNQLKVIAEEGGVLFSGVEEGLKRLRGKYPLFLVSNCRTSYLDTFFYQTGLRPLFQDAECYGNTGRSKGENIRAVVDRNGLQKAAYIGDTAGDQQAALAAGTLYFHVNYGFGEPLGDCWRFDDFTELTEFFLAE